MKNIKEYLKIKKDKSFEQKIKDEKRKMYFKETKNTIFKKRRKQLSLNINKFNYLNKIFKNKFIIYITILLILIITILLILFSPYAKIKYINIIKKDDITNTNIAYNSVEDIRGKSILNIDKTNIKDNIIKYQSNIKDINIDIILPNSLKITLESYKTLFYTLININNIEKKYLILSNGTLIPDSKENKDLKKLNIINNDSSKLPNFVDYKKIYSEKYLNNIDYIINKLKENIININIEELYYYTIERELHIKTENCLLIFMLEDNIDQQIKKLVIFNKDYKSITKVGIYYIDLRVKDKIFYCPIEEEKTCIQNIKRIYYK